MRHPVLIFFALVFGISWGGGLLVLGPGWSSLSAERFESVGALLFGVILAGPCLAGVLLTGIVDGRAGLRELFARLRCWRVGWRAYAIAVLPALVMAGTALLQSVMSSDFRPVILDSSDKARIVIQALGPALMFGVFEEIGWTGFAVPHLRSRHSIVSTGLTLGLVWGAWHFPLFYKAESFSGVVPLAILLTQLFAWLPPLRVLMVWIHDRTRSLPVVMLMHGVVSLVSLTLSPEGMSGVPLLRTLLLSSAAMWVLLFMFEAANRWNMGYSRDARSHQPQTAT